MSETLKLSESFVEFVKHLTDLELVALLRELRTFPEDAQFYEAALFELQTRAKRKL